MKNLNWTEDEQSNCINGLKQAQLDSITDPTDTTDTAILHYAMKLTQSPSTITQADVDSLRAVGLVDLAIHDLCAIVGYFAFVNRIANGLGVELEES